MFAYRTSRSIDDDVILCSCHIGFIITTRFQDVNCTEAGELLTVQLSTSQVPGNWANRDASLQPMPTIHLMDTLLCCQCTGFYLHYLTDSNHKTNCLMTWILASLKHENLSNLSHPSDMPFTTHCNIWSHLTPTSTSSTWTSALLLTL